MRKFGRPCNNGDSIRLRDVVEVPDAVENTDSWLRIMFASHIDEWERAGEWFVPLSDTVFPDEAPLITGQPVVNGDVLPLPKNGESVVQVAADAGCLIAQAALASEAPRP